MRKIDPKCDLYHVPLMARIELKPAFNGVKYFLSVKKLDPQHPTDPYPVQLEPKYRQDRGSHLSAHS